MKPIFKKIIVLVSMLSTSCLPVLASKSIMLDQAQRQLLLDTLMPNIRELYLTQPSHKATAGSPTIHPRSNLLGILATENENEDNSTRQSVMGALEQIVSELKQCCKQTDIEFQATWSILAGLDLDLTVAIDLSGVFTALEPCGPIIPITGPITITSAGSYCLANNIVGTITIAADNVIVDLNNKQLSNPGNTALSVNSQKNVIIKNGHIGNSNGAIAINNSTSVRIDNVQFTLNTGYCIQLNQASGVFISNVYFTQNKSWIIYAQSSTNVQFVDTIIEANQSAGCLYIASNSSGFIVDGCQLINNTYSNTPMQLVDSIGCTFKNSFMCHNTFLGAIFAVYASSATSQNVAFENLILEDNTGGDTTGNPQIIAIANTSGALIRDCVVSKNIASVTPIIGLNLANVTDVLIERNSINANGAPTGSMGIQLKNVKGMIFANKVQGASTAANYVVTGGGAIPIVQLSQSTATATVISGGSYPTSYHNLSIVP